MSGWIRALLALVIGLGVCQWAGLWAADQALAAALAPRLGVRPAVSVTAFPFWQLAQGRFALLTVEAQGGNVGGLRFRAGRLVWHQGSVDASALWLQHRVVVRRAGRIRLTLAVGQDALTRLLARATHGQLLHPLVTITPGGVRVSGGLAVHGTIIPVDTRGQVVVTGGGRAVAYQPQTFDGFVLPVLTRLTIFQVSSLPVPVPLTIRSLQLGSGVLTVGAGNP